MHHEAFWLNASDNTPLYVNRWFADEAPKAVIMIAHGMNPWIACMVTFAGSDIWYLSYMNSIYLCAHFGTQGKMARHGAMIKLSAAYTAICIVAFLISIPYWKMLGLIK